jgi:nucleoside phosphorylase
MAKRSNTGFTVVKQVSDAPMTQEQWESAEDLLAEMVAKAIMAEYQGRFEEVEDD